MLPKSLTTPIAMGVSETIGGIPSLSAVFGITAGILVAVMLPLLLRLLRVNDPAATGLAAGTAGSGIGAASVIPFGPVPAAFAGVAIGVNGLLTAALAPVIAKLLSHL
jgi:putative effector of murein hydrolase